MAIDKLDKIGEEGVRKEMQERNFQSKEIDQVFSVLKEKDFSSFQQSLGDGHPISKSVNEVNLVLKYLEGNKLHNQVQFDVTLARGLGYYTGCIFEVNGIDADMGSLGGGGRYDDLTGVFGWSGVPGVGISFGAERIYDVMEAKGLFPEHVQAGPKIILAAFDDATHQYAFKIVTELRKAGISSDLYPEPAKMKKQLKYADDIGCPYIGIIGENEMKQEKIAIKNLKTGEQFERTIDELINFLKSSNQ
jgi:histidyl-tRNA synthetase